MRYYRPYRKLLIFDILCAIAVSAIDLAFPQILNILQTGLFHEGPDVILRALGVIGVSVLLMYVIRSFCQYYIVFYGHVMGARMETDMRRDLFAQLQRLSFSYYDQHDTGELTSRLVTDLFDITELAHHGPENFIISGLKIIGSFVLLFFISVPMTLILMAVTAALVLFAFVSNRRMRGVFTDNRQKIAQINAKVKDSLAGIRVVQSFGNEEYENRAFHRRNNAFLESKKRTYRVMGTFESGTGLFQGILYTTILVSGGFFIAQGTLNAAQLAIYALYVGIFLTPIQVLISFTEVFQKGLAGFRRFEEILALDPDIRDQKDARPLDLRHGALDFRHVSFHYADDPAPVLRDINLQIPAGKTYALVGPSGSGKTTMCSLVPRFYDPTAGGICIDGQDIRNVTLESLRSQIGIVQQDVYLFTGTIRENIAYGKPDASDLEIQRAAVRANIHDFICELPDGYDTFVGEGGARLSGGQKQRIAIARVFLKNPPILILDEATSALDNESELRIQTALEKLACGRTTIIIAHRLTTVRNADCIVVMDGARIAESGTHAELLQREGLYARYYAMQLRHAG